MLITLLGELNCISIFSRSQLLISFLEGLVEFKSTTRYIENEMAKSKKIKSLVICLIAVVIGVIALVLIFGDFGWGAQVSHIWAKIVPAIFAIIGIAIIAYVIIESQNKS